MPNINSFIEQCNLLGIEHIRVDSDYDDSEYFKEDGSWKTYTVQTLQSYINTNAIDIISMNTYEHYEDLFKQTNIVFFMNGERDQIVFIGNGLILSERGGGIESWAYDTHTIEIEMKGGIRTFNTTIKDELIAQRILGVTANSLSDRDNNGKYKTDSLYGKIQAKTIQLMKEAGKWNQETQTGDLANVKLPWLYSLYVFDPIGAFYGDNYTGTLSNDIMYLYPHESFGHVWQVINNQNQGFIIPLSIQLSNINNNKYYYKFYACKMNNSSYVSFDGMEVFNSNSSSSRQSTVNNIVLNSYNKVALSVGVNNNNKYGICFAQYQKRLASTYGGINGSNTPRTSDMSQWKDLTVAYREQPFLIGMVFWITSYGSDNVNYPMLNGYITSIAFNKDGEILEPVCPYWDGSNTNTITDDTDPEIQPGGSKENYEPLPSLGYDNLNGKILIPMAIPITPTENNYAQNLNYIIVPTDWIPENYIDDEP